MWAWNGLICRMQGQVAASCERGDESMVSLKTRGISQLEEDYLAFQKWLC